MDLHQQKQMEQHMKKNKTKQLQKRLKEAEHIIKAVLIRKDYVIPTYVATMSIEYGDKYKLEI